MISDTNNFKKNLISSPSIIVLQARLSSLRLPKKVIMPIKGLPIVVLASKRASNTGRSVLVATSNCKSDDELVNILLEHKINFFRGDLNNVLRRFVEALEGYHNETIIIRLTSDNIFPDGQLLDEVEKDFLARNLEYIKCNGVESGLPIGVSVEITKLKYLREADMQTMSSYDREHVTPYIYNKYGLNFFEKYKKLNKGHLRCTIDYMNDYKIMQLLFKEVQNPIDVLFLDLIKNLELILNHI